MESLGREVTAVWTSVKEMMKEKERSPLSGASWIRSFSLVLLTCLRYLDLEQILLLVISGEHVAF